MSFFWPQFVYAAVNVAVVVPLDGEYKIFGEQIVQGVQSAVELINHDGGLNGQEINMITVNDPCDDSGALTVANMLAQNSSDKDKISLIMEFISPRHRGNFFISIICRMITVEPKERLAFKFLLDSHQITLDE